jgi:hypothetical protein
MCVCATGRCLDDAYTIKNLLSWQLCSYGSFAASSDAAPVTCMPKTLAGRLQGHATAHGRTSYVINTCSAEQRHHSDFTGAITLASMLIASRTTSTRQHMLWQ